MFYAAAIAPKLARNDFDPSIFVVAGDMFVDAARTPAPIRVTPNSSGYDGQFYYRLALAPTDFSLASHGVKFDDGPWRGQRILYPLLAWAASAGQPALVPWALLLVNLLGLAAVGYFAVRLTEQLGLHPITPVLAVAWPGFACTLTRDTTEIVTAAFLLASILAYSSRRFWLFALLASLTVLARETSILMFGGIFAAELLRRIAVRRTASLRSPFDIRRLLPLTLPIVLFLVWRILVIYLWQRPYSQDALAGNLTWPLMGFAQAAITTLGFESLMRKSYVLACMGFILLFGTTVVASNLRRITDPLVCGWLLVLGLMSALSAGGPWIEPIAFLRAFTECYLVGVLLLPAALVDRVWPFVLPPIAALWFATLRVGMITF